MDAYELTLEMASDIPVLHVKGAFTQETGVKMHEIFLPQLRAGKIRIVVDFTDCFVVNSLGIASLVDLANIVEENFMGTLVFCGLDKLNANVFRVSGLTPTIDAVPTMADAITFLHG